MIINAINDLYISADVYDVAGVETAPTYTFVRTVKMAMYGDDTSSLLVYTTEPLEDGQVLERIRDRNDALVMPSRVTPETGMRYLVIDVQPVINLFGYVEGYESRLSVE